MLRYFSALLLFFFTIKLTSAQPADTLSWWNPAKNTFPVLEGQAWPTEVQNYYDRLPAKAEQNVRKAVWDLSRNSAGVSLKFKTNATEISVRYGVASKGDFAMTHMPATGVSGLDLYAIGDNGKWLWAPGKRHFGDTIIYTFSNIEVDPEHNGKDHEFRLFLPLYNTINWMEIGVAKENTFFPLPLEKEKPIVVYGTSIAQGGCASRPGMAWPAILERQLHLPVINLGFSGNGKLEKSIIDLMTEIDASIYVLDCLPNLEYKNDGSLEEKIREAVKGLQAKRPSIPILLVEHSLGPNEGIINGKYVKDCEEVSEVMRQTFSKMKKGSVKNIYLLSNSALGLGINSTVDGIHPNDLGMKQIADAYTKIILTINSRIKASH